MGKIKRYRNVVERFLSGDNGQRFFNIAYSLGAAIVILGALFKILHLSGGDTLLSIGMGTEVIMFILTAFDRPPREPDWEHILTGHHHAATEENATAAATVATHVQTPAYAATPQQATPQGHGTVMAGNGVQASASPQASAAMQVTTGPQTAFPAEVSAQVEQSIKTIGDTLDGYIEQMTALNRNISGLNTIYEVQLRSVSSQLDAFDSVNRGMMDMRRMYEETARRSELYHQEAEKLTSHMQQLNQIYERMLQAMTVNMSNRQTAAPNPD
ncbi:MAG: gliding motility protein GldL [Paramuribaculum sp.]|nr:gliding motility protein GldL [Paramuribaculum sp.]